MGFKRKGNKMEKYNLKQEIKSLGMTQKEFAKHIGMHEETISKWVRGAVEIPRYLKLLVELMHTENKYTTIKQLLTDINQSN